MTDVRNHRVKVWTCFLHFITLSGTKKKGKQQMKLIKDMFKYLFERIPKLKSLQLYNTIQY